MGEACCSDGEAELFLVTSNDGRTEETGVPLVLGIEGEVMRGIDMAGDSLRGELIVAMACNRTATWPISVQRSGMYNTVQQILRLCYYTGVLALLYSVEKKTKARDESTASCP